MAGNIKGISIEFSANTEKLNGALRKTQGTLNKTQAELKAVNRSLKFNPTNTTLLRQKMELLQRTVTETRQKINDLRKLQNDMRAAGVKESSTQWKQLEREIIKTENQLKMAEADLRRFGSVGKQQALAVGQAFQTAGGKIKSAGRKISKSFSVYGASGIYAGKRLIDLNEKQVVAETKLAEVYRSRLGVGKKAVQSTLDLAKAEQKLGIIGDEVQIAGAQQLATFAKYPSTINTILPAMNNLLAQQKGVNATQDDAVRLGNLFGKVMQGQTGALRRWGISFTEAEEQVLKYGTEEEKAAMLAEVVTNNVGEMNKALTETKSGQIQQAKNLIGDLGEDIGAILLPAVADIAKWISTMLPKLERLINFFKEHPAIAKFALAIAAITAVAGPLIMIFGGIISAIGAIIPIVTAVAGAFAAVSAPVLAVVAAIAAAIAIGVALYKNWDVIKAKALTVWNSIKNAVTIVVNNIKKNFNTLKTNLTSLWNGIKSTASSVWNGIKNAITSPIESAKNKVKGIINKIKGFFPVSIGKIFKGMKLPHFSLSWGSKDFGKLGSISYPKGFSVSWYKKAMQQPYMFSNATLFGAGEAGSEVLYGRNALMKDIAQAVGGGGGDIIMNVYGSDNMSVNELANVVEQKLIQAQKRRTQAWA